MAFEITNVYELCLLIVSFGVFIYLITRNKIMVVKIQNEGVKDVSLEE